MKAFKTLAFNYEQCSAEVKDLQQLLKDFDSLDERSQILPFFRLRPQLSALCGSVMPLCDLPDRVAWEYELFGDFSCDLVIGHSTRRKYCFIELEDAKARSIFRRSKRATSDWSPRFEHGYSQIIDWFYSLEDAAASKAFAARFGNEPIEYQGVLVIGREHFLDLPERLRLSWRRSRMVVDSCCIHCLTYDELLAHLISKLAAFDTILHGR